jgi:molybdenum cofactor cytidylyltransferase
LKQPSKAEVPRGAVTGAILAAGRSVRMGRPKALLPAGVGGGTFVTRLTTALAEGGVGEVLVVVRSDDREIRDEVDQAAAMILVPLRVVENTAADLGQLSSVHAALSAVHPSRSDGLLVVPVDMPLVAAATISRLLEVFHSSRAAIVRAVHAGRHGHPVIFSRAVFDDLRQADPSVGARSVVRAHGALDVAVEDRGVIEDVDTPEDYERLFGGLR